MMQDYPLLQISIPEVFEESTENWDAKSNGILVAYLSEDYDEGKTITLKAYDTNGNVKQIDATNEPENPWLLSV
jgi:uncharacterized phage-like protein YoqJ